MGLVEFIILSKNKISIAEIYGNLYAKKVIRETFFLPKSIKDKLGDKVRQWRTLLFYGVC